MGFMGFTLGFIRFTLGFMGFALIYGIYFGIYGIYFGIYGMKLTAKAPENGWLEYFLVSCWGQFQPTFLRCKMAVKFQGVSFCPGK